MQEIKMHFLMLVLDVIFNPIANALNNHSARLVMTIVGAILFVGSWSQRKIHRDLLSRNRLV